MSRWVHGRSSAICRASSRAVWMSWLHVARIPSTKPLDSGLYHRPPSQITETCKPTSESICLPNLDHSPSVATRLRCAAFSLSPRPSRSSIPALALFSKPGLRMLGLASVEPRVLRLAAVDPAIGSGADRRRKRSAGAVAHGITFVLGEHCQAVGGETAVCHPRMPTINSSGVLWAFMAPLWAVCQRPAREPSCASGDRLSRDGSD